VKDLSKSTVSIVVGALIAVRLEALKSLHQAERMGHVDYQAQIQQELDANAAALRELNKDMAPWLEYHPQLRDAFTESKQPNQLTAQGE
jgi:hypothetical protein